VNAKPTLVQLILNATAAGKAMLLAIDAAAQKTLLSLEDVDNTSDANKPVSTAQQTAITAAQIGAQRMSLRIRANDTSLLQTGVTGAGVATTSGVGRSLASGATTGVARHAWNNGGINNNGFTYHAASGVDARIITWARAVEVQVRINITAWAATTSGFLRVYFGVPQQIGVALGNPGIGFELDASRQIRIVAHNGTTLTTGAVVGTAGLSPNPFFETYRLNSDGAGSVTLNRDGVLLGSITGGPTTSGTTNQCGLHVEIGNGGQSAANTVITGDMTFGVGP
jgi:hypothetical protein